jgi:hypothetical protein
VIGDSTAPRPLRRERRPGRGKVVRRPGRPSEGDRTAYQATTTPSPCAVWDPNVSGL